MRINKDFNPKYLVFGSLLEYLPSLALGTSLLLAYPWFVVAAKVQYSGFEGSHYKGKINHSNMFRSFKNTYKYERGIRGLYQGLVPASLFIAALYHADLYYVYKGEELFNVREEIKQLKLKYKF